MHQRRIYSAAILFLFLSLSELCAQYVFRHLDIVDGLSDNQIRYFVQTSDGRMAIRLVSSLNIYNGANFEHFYQERHNDYKWTFNKHQIFKEYEDAQGRLWLKNPGYLSLFDLNTNQFVYDIEAILKTYGITRRLKDLFVDNDKNLWFLTEDNSFSFYSIAQQQLYEIENGKSAFTQQFGFPKEIAQYKNLYWIVYSSGLIVCWDSAMREVVAHETYFLGKITEITDRLSLIPTSTGDLWLMYNAAVCFYNRIEKTWKEVADIKGASNFFTAIALDKEGNAWVGTSWSGLRKIDGKTHQMEVIPGLKLENGETSYNDIQCVFIDDDNGLWIGTLWQGICYYHPSTHKFELIRIAEGFQNAEGSVRCLIEGDEQTILIGTTNFGLLQYDVATGILSKAFDGLITNDICLTLYRDRKNRLWAGTYLNGFYCIDGQRITSYNRSIKDLERFPNQNISRAIYEDDNGRYWVSVANEGVGELNIHTGEISMLKDRHPEIAFHKVDFDFYPVDKHTFAVYGESGIYYYNASTDQVFIPERDDPDNPKFMKAGIRYYSVFKDSRSLEWFGTERGLNIWDEESRKAYRLTTDEGLQNNAVMAILEDNDRHIWASTANGIVKIEVMKIGEDYAFSIVNFNVPDGVQRGKFYEKSALKTSAGNLYFGGIQGFNVINPQQIVYNQSQKKPIFTALKLFNQTIKENSRYNGRILLNQPINQLNEVSLQHKENNLTLEFSGLNYVNPTQSYYRYKLENFDKDWTEILANGAGTATYTGLKPGTYLFKLQAANNDKCWAESAAELKILISPPFWATIYAYILYFSLFFASAFFLINYFLKINKRKLAHQLKHKQQKQKEELDQLKFRFFTNVSHEFRTPLSLIISPLEALIKKETDAVRRQKLLKINNNAKDLLNLVNQLLDFRKLEMKGETLHLSYGDLVEFADLTYQQFKEIAENEQIDFTLNIREEHVYMQFDKDKLRKILNNLLSNAFKYTSVGGQVLLSVEKSLEAGRECALIQVTDTGKGIPEAKQAHIFERFYQIDHQATNKTGSGIGLHLVKEYVALHEGTIAVKSVEGKGSTFFVKLPVDLKSFDSLKEERYTAELKEMQQEKAPSDREYVNKTLLIVEDNVDFRQFLVEQLETDYRIIQAADGEEGEQQALKELPDLIITDIMMPKVDGVELCCRLKTNIETSHVPIILLTARASDESKLTGYEAGADEYISKPFNFDILLLRIQQLIAQQESRKQHFRQTIEVIPQSIVITPLDEQLMQKMLSCIENNINNAEYSVDDLGADVGMSVRNLYRKIQSITGLRPADFIRSIRLKRAAQLLRDTQLNVSEISDRVGFNTIKYFNKHFKEEFGFSPTQYRYNHDGRN